MKFWIFEHVLGRGFGERLRNEGLESLERGFWVGCRNEILDGKISIKRDPHSKGFGTPVEIIISAKY